MDSIINYIFAMLPFMLVVFPPLTVWRVLRNRAHGTNLYHEIALMIFALFMVGLDSQTLLPRFEFGAQGLTLQQDGLDGINLIPFHILEETYIEVTKNGNTEYFIINFLGNIAVFIPIGFLLPLLWNIKGGRVLLTGAVCSLLIELCQLFLPRSSDVDDLILNTLGTLLGWLVYKLFSIPFKKFFARFKIS